MILPTTGAAFASGIENRLLRQDDGGAGRRGNGEATQGKAKADGDALSWPQAESALPGTGKGARHDRRPPQLPDV
jgi:hypothetical protein